MHETPLLPRIFKHSFLSAFLLFLLGAFFLFSTNVEALSQNMCEIRYGAFIPANKTVQKLYGNVGKSYSIEASHLIQPTLAGWVNLDYFSSRGKLSHCSGHTRLTIPNLSIGVKYLYSLTPQVTLYSGIGPSFSGVFIRNRSICSHDNHSRFAVGGVLKIGMYYHLYENISANFFMDYLYQPVRFQKNIDVGGVKTGIGIGYGF